MTDKNFKLQSLKVNPIYKPILDKLDAIALRELKELDKSVMWSRHYTKQEFKHTFFYPLLLFGTIIFCLISYGVKYRLYVQHIKMGRRLDFVDRLDLDLDDVSKYPPSVFEMY